MNKSTVHSLAVLVAIWGIAVALFLSRSSVFSAVVSHGPVPVKENSLAILMTDSLHGNLEPCGCGGNRTGGANGRIESLHNIRAAAGHHIPVVDGGDWLIGGRGPWDAVIIEMMIRLFRDEGNEAVCLGEHEIRRIEELRGSGLPLVCANFVAGDSYNVKSSARILSFLVTSIVDTSLLVDTPGVLSSAEEALDRVGLEANQESLIGIVFIHADSSRRGQLLERAALSNNPIVIVNVHHSLSEAVGISRCGNGVSIRADPSGKQIMKFSALKLESERPRTLILSKSRYTPSPTQASFDGTSLPGPTSDRSLGEVLCRLELIGVPKATSKDAADFVSAYLSELAKHVESSAVPYNDFVGSVACAMCHKQQFDRWAATPHARSFKTLEQSKKSQRPDCYVCHVTCDTDKSAPGHFPSLAPEHLRGVGCEICHGSGRRHVESPTTEKMRSPDAAVCLRCHIEKFDPRFDFVRRIKMATCQPSDAPMSEPLYFGDRKGAQGK